MENKISHAFAFAYDRVGYTYGHISVDTYAVFRTPKKPKKPL